MNVALESTIASIEDPKQRVSPLVRVIYLLDGEEYNTLYFICDDKPDSLLNNIPPAKPGSVVSVDVLHNPKVEITGNPEPYSVHLVDKEGNVIGEGRRGTASNKWVDRRSDLDVKHSEVN
mgnify:CR=1 FL=1